MVWLWTFFFLSLSRFFFNSSVTFFPYKYSHPPTHPTDPLFGSALIGFTIGKMERTASRAANGPPHLVPFFVEHASCVSHSEWSMKYSSTSCRKVKKKRRGERVEARVEKGVHTNTPKESNYALIAYEWNQTKQKKIREYFCKYWRKKSYYITFTLRFSSLFKDALKAISCNVAALNLKRSSTQNSKYLTSNSKSNLTKTIQNITSHLNHTTKYNDKD